MKNALVACGAAGLCAAAFPAPVPVTLTFDDGLKAHLTIAEPLIAARGWKATFNIVTGAAGRGGQNISWDEVRELHRRGHEIASHSVSHPNLLKLLQAGDTNEVRRQIAESRDKIKREVGVAPRWLCTPYIQHNAAVERISDEEGLAVMTVRRVPFGGKIPADKDYGRAIDAELAKRPKALDFLIHGITQATGGWGPFLDEKDFETFLDAIAEREKKGALKVVPYEVAYTADLTLERGFRRPPASARPWTWWHWMDGHVSHAGITADLEAMRDIGLGGATLFDVTAGMARGPVDFGTEAWFGAVGHAVREAHRLGLEIQVPNCSGYSSSGGPWVKPEQSMKFVAHTETRADGPRRFDGVLPAPPNPHGFYADIAVLAFPVPSAEGEPLPSAQGEQTFMGDTGGTVEFSSSEPFEATGVSFVLTGGHQWNEPARFAVAYSDDGVTWRDGDVRDFDVRRSGSGPTGRRYYPLDRPIRGKKFRITFSFPLDPTSPGYEPGYVGRFTVRDAALERRAALSDLDGKTFRIRQQIRRDSFPTKPGQVVALSAVTNLTHLLTADGRLAWDVPAGRWAILRIGFAANGERNHPVSGGGSGLEVDKLDRAALDAHFDAYVEKLCARLGPDLVGQGKRALSGILVDSYEVGSQTWTQGFERIFRQRRGYDLVPWLALLSGRVVESVAESERVLGDFRAVIAELFAENYSDALAARCRARGLQFGVECYGNGPFNALEYGRSADIPMCEFWAKKGDGVVNSTAVGGEGCARLAASVAHVNGRRFVGAESFTAFPADGKWQADPFSLKAQADRAFARGVNRLYFHRYAHQPWTSPTRYPGMTMGAWGTHFERTVTWWKQGRDFITYLSRVQFMLQAGENVADCLMTTGTETPDGGDDAEQVTTYGSKASGWPQPPEGYAFDWCTRRQAESADLRARYVVTATSEAEAAEKLRAAGLEPDFICETPSVTADVAWCHRRYGKGVEAYFVACGVSDRAVELTCSFRQAQGAVELWDAETGEIWCARRVARQDGRMRVTLALKPSGSVFVVFRPSSSAPLEPSFAPVAETPVAGPWTVTLVARTCVWTNLVDWAASDDPEVRHFSGTGAYETTVRLPACGAGERLVLDLGNLKNLAEVFVDGEKLPTLWRPPFRCVLPPGPARTARLRVEVTNLWPNRLIGDDFLSADAEYAANGGVKSIPAWVTEGRPSPTGRTTFTTWRHWTKDDRPLPSGLFGPVRLVTERAL